MHRGFESRNDDRFSVMFEGPAEEQLAARATTVLTAAFWRIGKGLGHYPPNSISVVLYTQKQFRDITRAPDWSAGLYDGRIRIPVRGAEQNLATFDRVLTHELTHAMIANVAPRGVPTWLPKALRSTSNRPTRPRPSAVSAPPACSYPDRARGWLHGAERQRRGHRLRRELYRRPDAARSGWNKPGVPHPGSWRRSGDRPGDSAFRDHVS